MKTAIYYLLVLVAVWILIYAAEKSRQKNRKAICGFFCFLLFVVVLIFV